MKNTFEETKTRGNENKNKWKQEETKTWGNENTKKWKILKDLLKTKMEFFKHEVKKSSIFLKYKKFFQTLQVKRRKKEREKDEFKKYKFLKAYKNEKI